MKEPADSETRPSVGTVDPVNGILYLNPWFVGPKNRVLEQKEWEYVIAHLALHLALNHAARRENRDPFVWNLACDVAVDRLLQLFPFARPEAIAGEPWQSDANEETIYEELMALRSVNRDGIPKRTLGGDGRTDILGLAKPAFPWRHDEEKRFGTCAQGVHPWVIQYLETRPDHLHVPPPKSEETFSTPRSWHILSDALHAYGATVQPDEIELLADGCLSANHARSFAAFLKQLHGNLRVDLILKGEQPLPRAATERDVLYFIVQSVRAQLVKELPPERDGLKPQNRQLANQGKRILGELCEISVEMATVMVAEEVSENARNLPAWFLIEVVRDLPRLATSVSVK